MTNVTKLTSVLLAGMFCLPAAGLADTQQTTTHRVHKAKAKKPAPPPAPLPSGTTGAVPQVPLDALPAVPPQVSYQDGLLTIVAPNSTLSEILRGVRKHTSADIEIPAAASERVATHLGPGPAPEVMAELLNGSRFNYILLGSPSNANELVRVVLVAKTGPDNPAPEANQPGAAAAAAPAAEAPEADGSEDDEAASEQAATEAEQNSIPDRDQQGTKTPQQMLQEMQQRQLQLQQQSGQQPANYPGPNGRPPQQPTQPPDQQ